MGVLLGAAQRAEVRTAKFQVTGVVTGRKAGHCAGMGLRADDPHFSSSITDARESAAGQVSERSRDNGIAGNREQAHVGQVWWAGLAVGGLGSVSVGRRGVIVPPGTLGQAVVLKRYWTERRALKPFLVVLLSLPSEGAAAEASPAVEGAAVEVGLADEGAAVEADLAVEGAASEPGPAIESAVGEAGPVVEGAAVEPGQVVEEAGGEVGLAVEGAAGEPGQVVEETADKAGLAMEGGTREAGFALEGDVGEAGQTLEGAVGEAGPVVEGAAVEAGPVVEGATAEIHFTRKMAFFECDVTDEDSGFEV